MELIGSVGNNTSLLPRLWESPNEETELGNGRIAEHKIRYRKPPVNRRLQRNEAAKVLAKWMRPYDADDTTVWSEFVSQICEAFSAGYRQIKEVEEYVHRRWAQDWHREQDCLETSIDSIADTKANSPLVTAMATDQLTLVPGERNQQIFRRHVLEYEPQSSIADDLDVSQQTVSKVVRKAKQLINNSDNS